MLETCFFREAEFRKGRALGMPEWGRGGVISVALH